MPSTELDVHSGNTMYVHGVHGGAVVGTSLTQTLTNKTISGGTITGATLTNCTGISVSNTTVTNVTLAGATFTGTMTSTTGTILNPTFSGTVTVSGVTWVGLGGGATKDITQASHGFSVGNVLKFAGGVYAKAQADSAANAEVVGMVSAVAGLNDFTILNVGYVSGLTGLTANTTYFLDPSTAGAITATEPSTAGQISKPVFVATSTTAGYFYNWRGMVITATSADITVLGTATISNAVITTAQIKTITGATITGATLANPTISLASSTNGDIWYQASGAVARLAKGAAGDHLMSDGTSPLWGASRKVIKFSYNTATSSGDVATTGVGFTPRLIIFHWVFDTNTLHGSGYTMGSSDNKSIAKIYTANYSYTDSYCIYHYVGATPDRAYAALKTFDSDGFTLTWTKQGGASGTIQVIADCYR